MLMITVFLLAGYVYIVSVFSRYRDKLIAYKNLFPLNFSSVSSIILFEL